jgi:hypothetical protein
MLSTNARVVTQHRGQARRTPPPSIGSLPMMKRNQPDDDICTRNFQSLRAPSRRRYSRRFGTVRMDSLRALGARSFSSPETLEVRRATSLLTRRGTRPRSLVSSKTWSMRVLEARARPRGWPKSPPYALRSRSGDRGENARAQEAAWTAPPRGIQLPRAHSALVVASAHESQSREAKKMKPASGSYLSMVCS